MMAATTKESVSQTYNIPVSVLEEYQQMGLCDSVRMVLDDFHYDDRDLENLSLIMALHDIGFDKAKVKDYMLLTLQGEATRQQRLAMIENFRREKLAEIHLREKQLDRMDYLRYKIRKEM